MSKLKLITCTGAFFGLGALTIAHAGSPAAVSYTHLTLPTIYSV